MLFNSFQFVLFFALVALASAAFGPARRVRVLLAASLAFYALWVPSALVVLGGAVVVNYALLVAMTRSTRPGRMLGVSVVATLGMLAFFKYGAFAAALLRPLVPALAPLEARLSWLVLPLGISFYSFEMVSIAVDVRRGQLALPTFSEYALLVTFFPHLIAGPILRGGELLPQLARGGERTRERTRRGAWLFVVGLVKKTILSDFLLQPAVADAFRIPGLPGGPVHLVGLYAFAFQIYFDFSGYTDMARGLACLLGFELPTNFEEPYLSRSPSEFWQRWHRTLSRWLRDYLYVPLGGNRRGAGRTRVNLMITMLLGGLWHGAGLNFLLWGALHGALLVAFRGARRAGDEREARLTLRDVPRIVLVFHLVCLCWVPFRAPTLLDALHYYRGLSHGWGGAPWPTLSLLFVVLSAALHIAERALRIRLPAVLARVEEAPWGSALEGALFGTLLTASVLASGAGVQFIYFQF